MPPRQLHYQLLLGREVIVTEQMDLHLVWSSKWISIKPLPRFILELQFWREYLCCKDNCACPTAGDFAVQGSYNECPQRKLWRSATGFLFSYAALICYESDFLIAQEKHLIPLDLTWSSWRLLVQELNTEFIYNKINSRFLYGELRLGRLSKIVSN
jgi:hypothetical protein